MYEIAKDESLLYVARYIYNVCMYICMHVCSYVCMYVNMFVYMYVWGFMQWIGQRKNMYCRQPHVRM